MNELVSIILPVYNGERYLSESIESVLAQTYQQWELLILDDCSSDSTPKIAQKYADLDARIKYFRNERNLRLPGNLNRGFSLSKGQYLTWTSDDNRFLPTALEKMVLTLNDENVDFVYASYNTIDEDGNITKYYTVPQKGKNIIVGNNCVGACFMYTRQVYESLGDYNIDLFLVEDFDYWQRIFANFRTKAILEVLYDYRMHGANLTNTMKKEQFYTAYDKMLRANIKLYKKLNMEQKYNYYYAINLCRKELGIENQVGESIKFKLCACYYVVFCEFPRRLKGKILRAFK